MEGGDPVSESGLGSGTGSSAGSSAEPGRLRRTLGFRDLVVYGLLFIAPMAPVGVFGTLD
ncbi:amino acid permease, partial [Streptomyces sp. SID7982]|nr:amino acid permease [Streptomyces sp. SID7982]